MLNFFTLALLASTACVSATPTNAGCNQDNCLRAVIGSGFPTRAGTADCSSYFRTTVTPATVTYTRTLSQTSSTTTSGTARAITTSTEIDHTTITLQTSTTSVETDFATVTSTVVLPVKRDEGALSDLPSPRSGLAKRQMTSSPSNIPAYASPCSGAVRYSSACSCVGVTRTTVTAVAPSTTVTVTQIRTQTSTYSTTSTSTTVETDIITSTAIQTNTIFSTTTSTSIALFTPPSICSSSAFQLQAIGGSFDGQYATIAASGNGEDDDIVFTSSLDSAATFSIDAAQHLVSNGFYANVDSGSSASFFYFDTPATIAAVGFSYATCSIGGGNAVNCVGNGANMFQICSGQPYSGSGVVIATSVLAGCTAFSFQAVC